ncbi:MAG: hypothetical protein N2689_08770 [Verrucomicrobiae bacterium]|nr:hypothetical protein [Verrucomicrobiae bacterium]
MSEKLLDAFTFKCTSGFKHLVAGVAMAKGMDASEFVRLAVEREINESRSLYEALHKVFGQTRDDGE